MVVWDRAMMRGTCQGTIMVEGAHDDLWQLKSYRLYEKWRYLISLISLPVSGL